MYCNFNQDNFENAQHLIDTIRKVHEELYPKATLETQCEKFTEEYNEAANSKNEQFIQELADMFIVACGIGRFNLPISDFLCAHIINKIEANNTIVLSAFFNYVCEKMNKNQKRVWNEEKDGYYKHEVSNND